MKIKNKGTHCNKGFIVIVKINLFIFSIVNSWLKTCVCDNFNDYATKAPSYIQAIVPVITHSLSISCSWMVAEDGAVRFFEAALRCKH